ncbi:Amidase domain-containing protein [Caenorhabditis elegans]|uniref:Amidase domain-containing protein n=1 Tax=Caenorhabditis elegans TaxID=6239 RepID=Q9U2I8_CAEEL|nr:Amidase domain-containing protein [Caenorhabditis elegans]CAB63353.2 Amidase domain-containing protein [Caenorhabditis elegans]|eukprot:NP_499508.2 Fatty Acid Amide Hydrolase homolog [Caenorhabditis elegans]
MGNIHQKTAPELQEQDDFETFRRLISSEQLLGDSRVLGKCATELELDDFLRAVVDLDLQSLIDKLQAKDGLNAYTVLCAYARRMLDCQTRLDCVAGVVMEAFQTAQDTDTLWYNSEEKPPLYGIPFSIKCDGESGLANSPITTHLRNLGAIPFVTTSISKTPHPRNPWALDCSPGGLCGGEAALVADGGAPFGFAPDLDAGSLRIASAFCGLVTLKPTRDRFHVSGSNSYGFYTKNVQDQVFLLKLFIGSAGYRGLEPMSSPAPLMDLKLENKLKIGWFEDDGFNAPVPSNRRAVVDTIGLLEKQGYEVVKFEMEDIFPPFQVAQMFFKTQRPVDSNFIPNLYKSNSQCLGRFGKFLNFPKLVARISKRAAVISQSSNMKEMCKNLEDIESYKLKFIEYWKSLGVDVLICPAFCIPAVPEKYLPELVNTRLSTGLFNMLDFPAGIVPAGHVTADDVANLEDEKIFPIDDALLRKQRDACVNSEAMPNSVQIVGLPNEEETVLEVMKIVENLHGPMSNPKGF